jgi:hypothetical protein
MRPPPPRSRGDLMKVALRVPAVFVLASLTTSAAAQVRLDGPTSVVWHGRLGGWLVSNVAGSPVGKDGRGWLSFIPQRDAQAEPIWLQGFNAPNGIAVVDDRLYVVDIDEVVVVNVGNRSVERRYRVPGARFLKGVTADPGGDVYVSDMLADTIHRLPGGGAPELFLSVPALHGPTSLLVDGSNLVLATWGVITEASSLKTRTPGRVLQVNLKTRQITTFGPGEGIGNLDGIVKDGDRYVVTDRPRGRVLAVSAGGITTVFKREFKGCAGLGFNPATRLLAIPEADAANVAFLPLP